MRKAIRFMIAASAFMAVYLAAEADDSPHWIGLDSTGRTADVVVSATGPARTTLDTRIVSRGRSSARTISGRPSRGLLIYFR